MSKSKKKQQPKTWAEVFQSQRKEFPQGSLRNRSIKEGWTKNNVLFERRKEYGRCNQNR